MLLSIAYPFIRKQINRKRVVLDALFVVTFLQYIAWMSSSLQSRFLMPLFPGLSIVTNAVILSFLKTDAKVNWSRVVSIGAVGGMLVGSFLFMGNYFINLNPYKIVSGEQSKRDFLSTYVHDYRVNEYINVSLPDDVLVFLPWDGRGYYCNNKCIPDIGQSGWTALIEKTHKIEDISLWLQEKGITHILLSWDDVNFFVYGHDPNGVHDQALSFFLDDYAPKCADLVYEDDWTQLYELHLDDVSCQ
jgi:hypothetical protein